MKKQFTMVYEFPPVVLPITIDELKQWGIDQSDIDKGEFRGELKTIGPWNIPVSYRALAMANDYDNKSMFTQILKTTVYGIRIMGNCRQSGYELEGYVSINGKKYSAFTSSQLFELPDGKLIDVATIHARVRGEN